MARSFVFLLLHFFALSAFGQLYNFDNYSLEHGLAQSQVQCITQDQRGYLWFGTLGGGVSQFDGRTFTTYNESNGLSNNRIYTVLESSAGELWFGTRDRGLTRFDGQQFTYIDTTNGLPHYKVFCSMEDHQQRLWFGTLGGGIAIFDGENWQTLNATQGLQAERIYAIHEAQDQTIWITSSTHGVFQYSSDLQLLQHLSQEDGGLQSNRMLSMTQDEEGQLWFGSLGDGISVLTGDSLWSLTEADGLISNRVRKMIVDQKGRVWIGTDGGITIYDHGELFNLTTQNGLAKNTIKSLHCDVEGNVWIGYDGEGVAMFKGERFFHLNDPIVEESPTWAIASDAQNRRWIGTLGNGILCIAEDTSIQFTTQNGLPNNFIHSLLLDSKGRMWIGCEDGKLALYENGGFNTINLYPHDPLNSIGALYEDRNGHIWIGSSRAGITRYDGEVFKHYHQQMLDAWNERNNPDESLIPSVYSITEDQNGHLWFCGGNGLFEYDGRHFKHYGRHEGLNQPFTYSLVTDQKGGLWIGTAGGGVYHLSNGKFRAITTANGLSSNSVWLLQFDQFHHLWVGTEKGVDKIVFADQPNGQKNFDYIANVRYYGVNEGFIGMETSQNTGHLDPNGHLWFATIKGVTCYRPEHDYVPQQAPKIYLTKVQLFLQETDWKGITKQSLTPWSNLPTHPELSYQQNHLSFEFVGIHTSNPKSVQYSYRLEGLEEDWSPLTDRNNAIYASIPPGTYTFQLKAFNNQGLSTEPPLQWTFTILPPFWNTWWFYSLCGAVFILLLISFFKYRELAHRKRTRVLENLVDQRTAELLQEKSTVEQQNLSIRSSINYAKRLQDSLLPDANQLGKYFDGHFVFYKPRDIVSGDFYWFAKTEEFFFLAVADCTGHGVPGAFMSMIGHTLLDDIINIKSIHDPTEVLTQLDLRISDALRSGNQQLNPQEEGMEISLLRFDFNQMELTFAGANQLVYLYTQGQFQELSGSIYSIGGMYGMNRQKEFPSTTLTLEKGQFIYLFTDGYPDQFGGTEDQKFMTVRFRKLLEASQRLSMHQQQDALESTFKNWKGVRRQIDDVLVIGLRV